MADEVLGNEFDGHAGADQQGRVFLEAGKKLLREMHGGRCDRDRAGADFRVGANFLRDGKRMLEQSAEIASQRVGLLRVTERVLELP